MSGAPDSDEEFTRMIKFFWNKREDPTSFVGYDKARFKKLMPKTYRAWKHYKRLHKIVDMFIEVEIK